MPRIERRPRAPVGAILAASATFVLIATATTASQSTGAAESSRWAVAPIGPDSEVSGGADALATARRMSVDATKPIFPMQVTPRCYVLDNFGESRPGGRTHEGIDILATLGQEVYAVVDGTLGRQVIDGEPEASLSGNGWRLTVASTKTWYVFMHLSAFAPGLGNGSVVEQGQLIGYVGDTGNPGLGNYHLHFEVHPEGGSAVDPLTVIAVAPGCSVS